jgi:hypothetical protein
MSRKLIFGEIPGIQEGHWFEGRKEMMPNSFHRNWGSGIDGNGSEGTAAIVLSVLRERLQLYYQVGMRTIKILEMKLYILALVGMIQIQAGRLPINLG